MRSKWLGCLLVLAASACGDSADDPAVGPAPGYDSGVSAVLPIPGVPGGTTGTPVNPLGAGVPGAGAVPGGVTQPIGGTAGGTINPPAAGGNLPCDVEKILKEKCQVCHAEPPVGAPIPLTKLAHFQVNSTYAGKTSEKISQRVKARIADTASPMPPVARPQLTAAEKTTLNAWLDGGAKGGTQTCVNPTPATAGGTAGTGSTGGGTYSTNCDYKQDLLAHGGQSEADTTPFNAPAGGDNYEIFWFRPKWTEKVQAIDIQPVIDNGAVLHHWLLYMKENGSETPGSHNSDIGLQSADSELLSGWAPGNKGFANPPDVGLFVVKAPQGRFGIELHYNTAANPPKRADRSGASVCVTKNLRPKEAATHWLGTQLIFGVSAVGTCSVPKESHIIAHSPHMHKMGKYMKTIITRANGQTETITDQAFGFEDQQIFPVNHPSGEHVVKPGDVITTTCDYTGFNTFGPGTDQEMCYNFVVAYPVGSLHVGAGVVGGKNTCIDLL